MQSTGPPLCITGLSMYMRLAFNIFSNMSVSFLMVVCMGVLVVQWLEDCTANLKVVGLNLAQACIWGIRFPRPYVSVVASAEAKQFNS